MTVKSRDTVDAGPFRPRALTRGETFFVRIFRDMRHAQRGAVTTNRVLARMVSPNACARLNKVQTGSHATERFVEVSTGHVEDEESPALAVSSRQHGPAQVCPIGTRTQVLAAKLPPRLALDSDSQRLRTGPSAICDVTEMAGGGAAAISEGDPIGHAHALPEFS